VSLALVLAALSTRQWVVAAAARRPAAAAAAPGDAGPSTSPPAPDARGRIALGLFSGRRHLNVGYGWRAYEVDGECLSKCLIRWVAVISAKNHKRQRRKRQSVTAKREKSQTPKVLIAILTLPSLT